MVRLLFVIMVLLPSLVWGACTGGNECTKSGTTWTCPTLELACIQAAHDDATCANGDTISLPSGTLEWPNANTSTLLLTKAVKIIGQGKTSTVVQQQDDTDSSNNCYASYSGGACFVSFKPDAAAIASIDSLGDTNTFEISGIHFETLNPTSSNRSAGIYIEPSTATAIRRVKIHDNKFTGQAKALIVAGNVYGVFYSNELSGAGMYSFTGTDTSWADQVLTSGGADYMYLEDNTTSGWDGVALHSGGGQGGRVAIRYNTIDSWDYSQLFEWHGNQGYGDPYGTMGVEIYGNKITGLTASAGIIARGGTSFVHHNYNSTSDKVIAFYVQEEYPNGCQTNPEKPSAVGEDTLTVTTPIGGAGSPTYDLTTGYSVIIRNSTGGTDATKTRDITNVSDGTITVASSWSITTDDYYSIVRDSRAAIDQTLKNTYYFNNFNTTSLITSITNDKSVSWWWNGLVEDTNYWRSYAMTGGSAFDGTKGIGCGTLATLQGAAYYTSCTDGVGFWVTDQNCTDISSYVGEGGAKTKISGTLYKCSSNSWSSVYTPYRYPHELRVTGASMGLGSGASISIGAGAVMTLQ